MPKRENERIPYFVQVVFRTSSSFLVAYSINISRGGLFLETPQPLSVGALITLDFSIPGASAYQVPARVAWRRDVGIDGPAGVGVEFLERAGIDEAIDALVRGYSGLDIILFAGEAARNQLPRAIRSVVATANVLAEADADLTYAAVSELTDVLIVDYDHAPEAAESLLARAHSCVPPVPTIVLAADDGQRSRLREAGYSDALHNPPRAVDFQRALMLVLSRPSRITMP